MGKKYFWLKLKDDFFTDKKIKKLRKVAGGDTYTIIYLKMQLLSLKNDGLILFDDLESELYEEIALEIDEDEDNVKFTLMFLMKYGLVEEVDEKSIAMLETINNIGKESESASRVRALRERQKQKALQCNVTEVTCNTEKEKEKEKEKELNNKTVPDKSETEKILNDLFEKWYNLYDHKKGRPKAFSAFKTCLQNKKYDIGTLLDKTYEYINGEGLDKKYRKHPSTFLNQYHPDDDYTKQNGNLNKPKNNFMEALNERTGSSNFINNDSKLLPF